MARRVKLTQGYVALIDGADARIVSMHRWKILKSKGKRYAVRNASNGQAILMHRVIANAASGQEVDHKNGNGLDNRRENLRFATHSQNMANMLKCRGLSKYKGVYWNREKGLWQAQIRNGFNSSGKQKTLYLGRFTSERAAARAYNAKAFELHGEFARLNRV